MVIFDLFAHALRLKELNHLVSEDADHIRSLLDMLMMTKSITQAPQPRDTKEELLELADLDISNLCIEGKAI